MLPCRNLMAQIIQMFKRKPNVIAHCILSDFLLFDCFNLMVEKVSRFWVSCSFLTVEILIDNLYICVKCIVICHCMIYSLWRHYKCIITSQILMHLTCASLKFLGSLKSSLIDLNKLCLSLLVYYLLARNV